jgi:CDP-glucose 4,6-dehydratase
MEDVVTCGATPDPEFWLGRRVLLTGHTGFKGGWLSLWLAQVGAEVHGFSLAPPTQPNLFERAGVARLIAADVRGDVRDAHALGECVRRVVPSIVFHLAAQPLVRSSYAQPVETFSTNVMGTVHLLEAARGVSGIDAIVVITSDKCYENDESLHPRREIDRLGGKDPYSASKACAELVTASWRAAFAADGGGARIATARAGNVIGAGDWAEDRLLPDCLRAFDRSEPVRLRNPAAVRPWQHVLEPLCGYLTLAERLCAEDGSRYASAWNFGPDPESEATVERVARQVAAIWGSGARIETVMDPSQPREAVALRLDSTAARLALGWRPRWSLSTALRATVEDYQASAQGADLGALARARIQQYASSASAVGR